MQIPKNLVLGNLYTKRYNLKRKHQNMPFLNIDLEWNFNDSNTDGSSTVTYSNSFWVPRK